MFLEHPLAWFNVFLDFFKGAGIDKLLDQLEIKNDASRGLIPVSIFSFYDHCSRSWIHKLVIKAKYFNKPLYKALKNSLILMRNQAEGHGLKKIRLPDLACGLDKLQPSIVYKIYTKYSNRQKLR